MRRHARATFRAVLVRVGCVFLSALLLYACDNGDEAGSYALTLRWPADGAPNCEARELFLHAAVEEFVEGAGGAGGDEGEGSAAVAGWVRRESTTDETSIALTGEGCAADLSNFTISNDRYEKRLRVVVEIREGRRGTDALAFYGLSDEFTLTAGEFTEITASLDVLRPAPGAGSDGGKAKLRLVAGGKVVEGFTNEVTPTLEVGVDPRGYSSAMVATNVSLNRGAKTLGAGELQAVKASKIGSGGDDDGQGENADDEKAGDGTYFVLDAAWNLNTAIADEEVDGERQIYVSFVGEGGVEGPVLQLSVTLDRKAPAVSFAATKSDYNAADNVTLTLSTDEQLSEVPLLVLSQGGGGAGGAGGDGGDGREAEEPLRPFDCEGLSDEACLRKLSFTYRVAATSLAEGVWNATFAKPISDRAQNAAEMPSTTFAVDATTPVIEGLQIAGSRFSDNAGHEVVRVTFTVSELDEGEVLETTVALDSQDLAGVATWACSETEREGEGGKRARDVDCTYTVPTRSAEDDGRERVATFLVRTSDAAGNEARAQSATTVFDFKAPELLTAEPNLTSYRAGSEIALIVSFDERVPGEQIALEVTRDAGGASETVEGFFGVAEGDGPFTFRHEVGAGAGEDGEDGEDGEYVVGVKAVDEVGNAGAAFERPETARFLIDATLPSVDVSSVAIESSNAEPRVARAGDTVTVRFNLRGGEALTVAPRVTLAGAVMAHRAGSSNPYEYTWVVDNTRVPTPDTDGAKQVAVSGADDAGNSFSETLGTIEFDFIAPSANCTLIPENAKAGDEQVLTVVTSEPLRGGAPSVTSLAGGDANALSLETAGVPTATKFQYVVKPTAGAVNVPAFSVTVSGLDRTGNRPEAGGVNPDGGEVLCAVTGSVYNQKPRLIRAEFVGGVTTYEAGTGNERNFARASVEPTNAMAADRLRVRIVTDDPVLVDATGGTLLTLSGTPLAYESSQEVNGDVEYIFGRALSGDEGDGPKVLLASLRDAAGNETAVDETTATGALLVTFDFTPPAEASCVLSPTVANRRDVIRARVGTTEPLRSRRPDAVDVGRPDYTVETSSGGDALALAWAAESSATAHTLTIATAAEEPVNIDGYTLRFTATDLAGNESVGALCTLSGAVYEIAPAFAEGGNPKFTAGFREVDGVRYARAGNVVEVSFRTVNAIDRNLTRVTLGGFDMGFVSVAGGTDGFAYVYRATVEEAQGNGVKQVGGTLFDSAGNSTPIDETTLNEPAPSVTFDFVAPELLQVTATPNPARNDVTVTVGAVFSEPLSADVGEQPSFSLGGGPSGFGVLFGAAAVFGADRTVATLTSRKTVAGDSGAYTFGYVVFDRAGNRREVAPPSVGAGNVVFEIDAVSPSVTPTKVVTTNTKLARAAKAGDVVYACFTVVEANAASVTATIGGRPMTRVVSGDGDFGTPGCGAEDAVYRYPARGQTLGPPVDSNGGREVVARVVDAAQNVTEVTFGELVTYDFSAPVIVAQSVTPERASLNDTVEVAVTFDEPVNVEFDLGGLAGFAGVPGVNDARAASYLMSRLVVASDASATNHRFRVVRASDAVGNELTDVALGPGAGVTVDGGVPVVRGCAGAEAIVEAGPYSDATGPVVIGFRVDADATPVVRIGQELIACEKVSGACDYTCSKVVEAGDVSGLRTVTVEAMDGVGNVATPETALIEIDTGDPVLLSASPSQVVYTDSDAVSINATFSENLVGAPTGQLYRIADFRGVAPRPSPSSGTSLGTLTVTGFGATTNSASSYTFTRAVAHPSAGTLADGFYVVDFSGTDAANNTSTAAWGDAYFQVDATAPTVADGATLRSSSGTSFARAGQTITAAFTASEPLRAMPTARVAGRVMTCSSPDLASAKPSVSCSYVVVGGDSNAEPQGAAEAVVTLVDGAGNRADATLTGVTIDTVAPRLLTTSSVSPVRAGRNATVEIRANFSEPVTGASFNFDEATDALYGEGRVDGKLDRRVVFEKSVTGEQSVVFTRAVQANDAEVLYAFRVEGGADAAGNLLTATTIGEATLDTTAPSVALSGLSRSRISRVPGYDSFAFSFSAVMGEPVTVTGEAGKLDYAAAVAVSFGADTAGEGGALQCAPTVRAGPRDTFDVSCTFTATVTTPAGFSTLLVLATDGARNAGGDDATAEVDVTPPALADAAASKATYVADERVIFNAIFSEALLDPQAVVATLGRVVDGAFVALVGSPLAVGVAGSTSSSVSLASAEIGAGAGLDGTGYTFAFGVVADAVGNEATLVRTDSAALFAIDATDPTIVSARIAAGTTTFDGAHYAKRDGQVVVCVTPSEPLNLAATSLRFGGDALKYDDAAECGATTCGAGELRYCMKFDTEGDGSRVLAGALSDMAGNGADYTGAIEVTFDKTEPTVVQSVATPSVAKAGDTVKIAVSFSELLKDEPTLAVSPAGSGFARVGSCARKSTCEFTWTPTGAFDGVRFTPSFSVVDYAGNAKSGLTQGSFTVDTVVPTLGDVAVVRAKDDATPVTTRSAVEGFDEFAVVFTTSEDLGANVAVTGNARFSASVGTRSFAGCERVATMGSPPNVSYRYACGYVVTEAVDGVAGDGARGITIRITDVAGNAVSSSEKLVVFDFTAPSLLSNAVGPEKANPSSVVAIDLSFNEAVTGADFNFDEASDPVYGDAGVSGNNLVRTTLFAADPSNTSQRFRFTRAVQPASEATRGDEQKVYTFTVAASDAVGNRLDETVIGTTEIDAKAPVISNFALSHDRRSAVDDLNDYNVLTVFFSLDEVIETGTTRLAVNVGGRPANCTRATLDYTCIYTVTGGAGGDTEGPNTVSVRAFDLAGNESSTSSTVTFDFTPPALVGDAVAPSLAGLSRTIVASFSFDEDVQGASVNPSFGGLVGFAGGATGARTYRYAKTVTEGDAEGYFTFAVSPMDSVGNAAVGLAIGVTDIGGTLASVKVDRTAPMVSAVTIVGEKPAYSRVATFNTFEIAFSVDEALARTDGSLALNVGARDVAVGSGDCSGPTGASAPFGYRCTFVVGASEAEGRNIITVRAVDAAGNEQSRNKDVAFDFSAPKLVSPAVAPANAGRDSTVTISVGFDEAVAATNFNFDGAGDAVYGLGTRLDPASLFQLTEEVGGQSFTFARATVASDVAGTYVFKATPVDAYGNAANELTLGATTIDNRLPEFAFGPAVTDEVRSKVAGFNTYEIVFALTDGEVPNAFSVTVGGEAVASCIAGEVRDSRGFPLSGYRCPVTVTEGDNEGVRPIVVTARDLAGNSVTGSSSVTYDFTSPRCAALAFDTSAPYRVGKNATATLQCDERLDAVPTTTLTFEAFNGSNYAAPTAVPVEQLVVSKSLSAGDSKVEYTTRVFVKEPQNDEGRWNVAVTATDVVGNTMLEPFDAGSFFVDGTAPTIALTGNRLRTLRGATPLVLSSPGAALGDLVTLDVVATDAISGSVTPSASLGGIAMTTGGAFGNFSYSVTTDDRSGGREGLQTIVVTATDPAGNAATATYGPVRFDFTPPTFVSSAVTPTKAGAEATLRVDVTLDEAAYNIRLGTEGLATFTPMGGGTVLLDDFEPSQWPTTATTPRVFTVAGGYAPGKTTYSFTRDVQAEDQNRLYTFRLYAEDELGNATGTTALDPVSPPTQPNWSVIGATTIESTPVTISNITVRVIPNGGELAAINLTGDANDPVASTDFFLQFTTSKSFDANLDSLEVSIQGRTPMDVGVAGASGSNTYWARFARNGGFSEGLVNAVIQATDPFGNVGFGSTQVEFDFTGPRLTNGVATRAAYPAGASVTYIAEFSEALDFVTVPTANIRDSSTRSGGAPETRQFFATPVPAAGNRSFTFTSPSPVTLADEGTWGFGVVANGAGENFITDRAGNALVSVFTNAAPFVIDATPPSFTAGSPALFSDNPMPFSTAYARAGQTITARFATDATPATVSATIGNQVMALARSGSDYTATCAPPACSFSSDGLKIVSVSGSDDAGNPNSAIIGDGITYDTVPPSVVESTISFALTPAASNVLNTVTKAKAGTRITAAFLVNEPLHAAPTVRLINGDTPTASNTIEMTLVSANGVSYVYTATAPAGLDEGTYNLLIEATDVAGNSSGDVRYTGAGVTYDATPPDAPATGTADLFTYTRIPWGSDDTNGDVRMRLRGAENAAPEGAGTTVIAYSAASGGAELGRYTLTSGDGTTIPEFELIPGDRTNIWVELVDAAGNLSGRMPVKDVEWVATLGGKVAGSTFENPHEFAGSPRFASPLFNPNTGSPDAPLAGAVATLGINNGDPVTQAGNGVWDLRGPTTSRSPIANTNHAMVYDSARGKVVVFGGAEAYQRVSSDTWEWDGGQWTRVATTGPSARYRHAMAYDIARGRVVMFGGFDGTNRLPDTWEWDGASWMQVATTGPSARVWHAMAYDNERGKVVMFGGFDGTNRLPDTWEWDGTSWTQVASAGPSARSSHAMAYHSARGTVVLFGGFDGTNALSDTWEWDGASWTQIATTGLGARYAHAMTYDGARGKVVLFGGRNPSTVFGDTWEWDGTRWTRVATTVPSVRMDHAMTYDGARKNVVMFGGANEDDFSIADTWQWNGASWMQVAVNSGPISRVAHAMAYDSGRGNVVLFGGFNGATTYFDDTWEWNGARWTQVVTSGPSARSEHAMTFDSKRGRVVLFGGWYEGGRLSDTWEWDGASWTLVATTGPSARRSSAMVYDSTRGKVVLFGGLGSGQLGDTWEWDGTKWTRMATTGPLSRDGHAMAYDASRGRVVLFGGENVSTYLSDTWEWDGASWTQVATTGPSARRSSAMAYDMSRGKVVMFGGTSGVDFSDTWEWGDTMWTQIASTGPTRRYQHAVAYDGARGKVVLFGGSNGSNETWEWDGVSDAVASVQASFGFGAARATGASVLGAWARMFSGGIGYPVGTATTGAELLVWDQGQWKPVASNTSGPDTPSELAWSTTDPIVLNRIFFGNNKALNFAVRPIAPNGTGDPDDPSKPYGEISTDYVEVTVKYRLP